MELAPGISLGEPAIVEVAVDSATSCEKYFSWSRDRFFQLFTPDVNHSASPTAEMATAKSGDHHSLGITVDGLLTPIVVYQNKILDGRNRDRGCIEAEVTPRYVEYIGSRPLGLIVSRSRRSRTAFPSCLFAIEDRPWHRRKLLTYCGLFRPCPGGYS